MKQEHSKMVKLSWQILVTSQLVETIFQPGWSWEKCVKPIVKTDSCQPHTQYIVSGRIKVVMDDGEEEEFGPGDARCNPTGTQCVGCWK